MRFRRFRKKFSNLDIRRNNILALVMALACMCVGYLIVTITNSSQKIFNESNAIEALISDADNIDAFKEKVKNNPDLLKKLKSSGFKDENLK